MSTTRQIRKQIKSAKNIAKITKAMQMVAASKMKRAQDVALSGRNYAQGISRLAYVLAGKIDPTLHPLLKSPSTDNHRLILIIAPEKGLCGGLNTSLTRALVEFNANYQQNTYIAIGKKAINIASALKLNLLAQFEIGTGQPQYDMVLPVTQLVKNHFLDNEVDEVKVIYTGFVNTMTQKPAQATLLPLKLVQTNDQLPPTQPLTQYLFEPSAEVISDALLTIYLELEIYQLLLEAYASEQSARMVAMKNATDNARNLITNLTQTYNKARQSSITTEIIDIATAGLTLSN